MIVATLFLDTAITLAVGVTAFAMMHHATCVYWEHGKSKVWSIGPPPFLCRMANKIRTLISIN
nr:MAG TPA: hypothetical protein [Caudoviricetes sp.]